VRALSLCLTCVLLSGAGLTWAQEPDDDSVQRIREALQKPARLSLTRPRADFSVHIEQRRPLQDIFDRPVWVTIPPEFAPPPGSNRDPHDATIASVSIDPGVVAQSISRAVRTRQARDEVRRTITEYCYLHRYEPGAAAICGDTLR
jgi:hypothetical protein